jgi:hypothetical protein
MDSIIKESRYFANKLDSVSKAAQLPVGWPDKTFLSNDYGISNNVLILGLIKIIGLVITGFAASFGAPFWFDVLKKAYSAKV